MKLMQFIGIVVAAANLAVMQAQVLGWIDPLPFERNFGAGLLAWIAGSGAFAAHMVEQYRSEEAANKESV